MTPRRRDTDEPLFDPDYRAEDGAQLDLLTGEVADHDGPARLYEWGNPS